MSEHDPHLPEMHEADRAPARAAPRDSMLLLISLATDDGRTGIKARVRNISATGLMAECTDPLLDGTRIVTELRGIGEVSGSIVWATKGRIGIAFDREIDPRLTRTIGNPKTQMMVPQYLSVLNHPPKLPTPR